MKLTLRLNRDRLRRWHISLAERLAERRDVELAVVFAEHGEPYPAAFELLLNLERLVYGIPGDDITVAAKPGDFEKFRTAHAASECVIDFTGPVSDGTSNLQVLFDGAPDEAAIPAALMEGRTPLVTIADSTTGKALVQSRPGTDQGGILSFAWRDVLARTSTAIVAALDGAAVQPAEGKASRSLVSTATAARYGLNSLARAAVRAIYRLCYNAPHWRVGWRFVNGQDLIDLGAHPATGWHDLPDDRSRFYADPFPIEHGGRTFVFVEDFAHALGYGVISAIECDERGPMGTPRPVLDTGSHLSYPFVFSHANALWMIPESSAAGTVELYRAQECPHRWVKEATLLSNIRANDATLFERDGQWWMLATVNDDGGASSDALHVWSAPDLLGPWHPHRRNPVLIDIGSARPAGRVVYRNGRWIRPFQDCRAGYGAALGLAEITRLDADGFAQRIDTILRPGPLWPGRRLHTLNRAGRLECIDGSAMARRF